MPKLPRFYLLTLLIPLIFVPFGMSDGFEIPKQVFFVWTIGIWLTLWVCMQRGAGRAHGASAEQVKNLAMPVPNAASLTISVHKPTLVLLGLWVLSFSISTILSVAPVESFWGTWERLQGFFIHIYYAIHLLICLSIFRDKKTREVFTIGTILVGVLVSIYALAQASQVGPFATEMPMSFGFRTISTLGSPTALGQYLLLPLCLIFGLLPSLKGSRSKISLLVVGGVIILAALVTTQNRASLLALAVVGIIFVLLKIKTTQRRIFASVLLTLFAAGLLLLVSPNLRSVGTRAVLWKASLHATAQAPIFGSGPETMYQTLQKAVPREIYDFERITDITDRAHNIVLDTLLARGIFGLLIGLLSIAGLGAIVYRHRPLTPLAKSLLAAIGATVIALQFGFSSTTHIVLLLSFVALLLRETVPFKKIQLSLVLSEKVAVASVCLCAALFGMIFTLRLAQTNHLFSKGISDYFKSEEAGLARFDEAITLSPQYGYLYRSVFILMGNYVRKSPEARELLKQYAAQLSTVTNDSFHTELAYAALANAENNEKESDAHFARAAEKAPFWSVIYMEWARVALAHGDYKKAIEKLETVLAVAPVYWRWDLDRPTMSAADKEKARIFRISNQSLYEALELLATSYEKVGRTVEADKLRLYRFSAQTKSL